MPIAVLRMSRGAKTIVADPLAEIGAALDNPAEAPTMAAAGERVPESEDDHEPFPRDCPIKPLGEMSGLDGTQRCYYLNVNGEIVGLDAGNKHGKNNMIALFGHKYGFLEAQWPQWSKPVKERDPQTNTWVELVPAKIVGFDQKLASQALIAECFRLGIFDPTGRMRGRGAHAMAGGGLVLHFGDALATVAARANGGWAPMKWHETGLHARMVYPAGMAIPRPWHEGVAPSAAITLCRYLQRWFWKRPMLDPVLALGAIGQGFVSGALPWRSNVWITGGAGTGKSSLNGETGLVPRIYGDAVFRTANTSAAAIRQMLRNSTVPVMIDEAEPGPDGNSRKITEVVELARVASSGGKIYRGGQDHTAHEFTMQSAFWFSSINIPPMEAADRSRLAILELRAIPEDAPALLLDSVNWADVGAKLQRRMIDAWPLLAQCKALYHAALAAKGHRARACDQFGNLLACAWLLLNDELPDADDVMVWIDLCAPDRLAEVSDSISDEDACLQAMLTHQVQPRGRDSREAISTLIGRAIANAINPAEASGEDDQARRALEQFGLKLVNLNWAVPAADKPGRWGAVRALAGQPIFVAVASGGKPMSEIFAGSKWAGGGHRQTLARIDGAVDGVLVKMASAATRTTMVPLHHVLHESELPAMSRADAASAWMVAHKEGAGV